MQDNLSFRMVLSHSDFRYAPSCNMLKSHPVLCSVNSTCSTVGDAKESSSDVSAEPSSVSVVELPSSSLSDTSLKYKKVWFSISHFLTWKMMCTDVSKICDHWVNTHIILI